MNCFQRCLPLCGASPRATPRLRSGAWRGGSLWSIKLVSPDKIDECLMRFLRSLEGYPEMLQNKQTGEIMNESKAAKARKQGSRLRAVVNKRTCGSRTAPGSAGWE